MDTRTFFDKFETFADTPEAIGKLRELVVEVELANQPITTIDTLNPEFQNGASSRGDMDGQPIIVLRLADIEQQRIYLNDPRTIPIDPKSIPKYELRFGDVLVTRVNGSADIVGTFIPVDREIKAIYCDHFIRMRLDSQRIDPTFAALVGRSNGVRDQIKNLFISTAGQKTVNQGHIRSLAIPLPPLAEQKRIVAKVDELIALCDRLEAEQKEREAKHAHLARAALARFAEAPTPANLDYLFHKSYTIDPADLRKSILTMAVQGKMVPQDANDEPATELVKKAHNGLTTEKRRRAPKPLPTIDNPPYGIPSSWTWARFQEIAFIASNLVDPKPYGDMLHLAPDNIVKGTGTLLPCRTVREDEVKSGNHLFYAGQLVYSKIRPNLSKVVLVDFDGLCSADMYPIDPLIDPQYLLRFMLSEPFLQQAVKTDTRVAMPKINQNELNAVAIAVPPVAEQRRIVAKVDALMALVDQLEAQLAESRAVAGRLMEAVVAELTRPAGERVDVKAVEPREANVARLACYVLKRWGDAQPGRTKLEKAFDFSQTHCGAALGREAKRKQHGPVDYDLLRAAEAWAGERGGFATDDPGNHEKVIYTPEARFDTLAAEGEAFLGDCRTEVDRVLDLLAPLSTTQCGDLATVYNAWAGLIAKGEEFNDRDIIHVCRHEWHEAKTAIADKRWFWAIRFLQANRLTPTHQPGQATESVK